MKPLVGVSALYGQDQYGVKREFVDTLRKAGAEVILFPAGASTEHVKRMVEGVYGILLPGGPDISPLVYGRQPVPQVTWTWKDNDRFEIAVVREAMAQKKPLFAICRGMQLVNVALGGTLVQDINSQWERPIAHQQSQELWTETTHTVEIVPGSRLHTIVKNTCIEVNSFHHQAVDRLGEGLIPCAKSPDGIVEGLETEDGLLLAVQWHPETLTDGYPKEMRLFEAFVDRCRSN